MLFNKRNYELVPYKINVDVHFSSLNQLNLDNYLHIETTDGSSSFLRFSDTILVKNHFKSNYQIDELNNTNIFSEIVNFLTQLEPRILIGLNDMSLLEQKVLKKVRVEPYNKDITNMFYSIKFKKPISLYTCVPMCLEDYKNFILVKPFTIDYNN